MNYESSDPLFGRVRRQLGVILDSKAPVIEKKICLYIYSVQKMILKFYLKLLWWT